MRVRAETFELEPHPQADRLADSLAERRRHARRRRARGETARLQQNDLAALRPVGVKQCERNRAWFCRRRAARRRQDCTKPRAQRGSPAVLRRSAAPKGQSALFATQLASMASHRAPIALRIRCVAPMIADDCYQIPTALRPTLMFARAPLLAGSIATVT